MNRLALRYLEGGATVQGQDSDKQYLGVSYFASLPQNYDLTSMDKLKSWQYGSYAKDAAIYVEEDRLLTVIIPVSIGLGMVKDIDPNNSGSWSFTMGPFLDNPNQISCTKNKQFKGGSSG